MKIHKSYRYELKPNKTQIALFFKYVKAYRFVYNWGLSRRIELYKKTGKSTSAYTQAKELVILKRTEFTWLKDVSSRVPEEALKNIDYAYKDFFRRIKKREETGRPRFKRDDAPDRFNLRQDNNSLRVFPKSVQLPKLGKVRLKEKTNVKGKIYLATVTREADRWFVSISAKEEINEPPVIHGEKIGLDMGFITHTTLSNGEKIESPKPLKKYMKLLKRRARQHSKKKKGSKNRIKASIKLARLHSKIRNIRKDFLHKTSTKLAKTKSVIVIESLNMIRIRRTGFFGESVVDASLGMYKTMIRYKTQWYGSELVEVPRLFPSTKTCSNCNHILKSLKLSKREWVCPECGAEHDRDINAAKNLLNFHTTGMSPESYACGDTSAANNHEVG